MTSFVFLPLPTFVQEWRAIGLDDADLAALELQIIGAPGKPLVDLADIRVTTFAPPSAPKRVVRAYYGFVTPTHVALLTAVQKAKEIRLPAADRARIKRRLLALKAAIGTPTEKRRIEIAAPKEYDEMAIRRLRIEMGVSQAVFAELLGVSKMLVESWEQGIRVPSLLARRLLDAINDDPSGFLAKWTMGAER